MNIKGLFTDQPISWQLFILLIVITLGGILGSVIGLGLFQIVYGSISDMNQHPDMMRLFQFISACGTFLLPALATAWLCSDKPKDFLSVKGMPDLKIILLVFFGIILINPLINLTSLLNESMKFPQWAAPIESWMRQQENSALFFTDLLINGEGISPLLSNLIVIALTAAISEEFLFRGTIQSLLGRGKKNLHLTIWLTAVIFSAFHLQFYGFIPRMLLGAYLGYLLVWTRNIWVPIAGHFFNNAISVIVMSTEGLKDNEFINGKISDEYLLPYIGAAILATIGFLYLTLQVKKKSKELDSRL